MKERLQKLLAQANIGSRRASEDLISAGRVRVNGKKAELGDKADPATDVIEVDGATLKFDAAPHKYIMLNKPKQVLSTDKPHRTDKRETVSDLIGLKEHLFSIGRLDADSEGMVVMTNDGDLAQKLSHPRYRHTKTYKVEVHGLPTAETLDKWRQGVFLEDGKTAPCFVEITHGSVRGSTLRVIMTEGKKRQIRRVASLLGHPVSRLTRTHIGMLPLGDLEVGKWRELAQKEVMLLRTSAPEGKALRATPRRRAADYADEAESTEEKPHVPRARRSAADADDSGERRRSPRSRTMQDDDAQAPRRPARTARRTMQGNEDEAPRRTPRTRASDAEEAPKRRVPRVRTTASDDASPDRRRTQRIGVSDTDDSQPARRRVRTRTSDTEETPKPRRAPRTRASDAEDTTQDRRTPRARTGGDADSSQPKRRTPRTRSSDADSTQEKRRTPRKSGTQDDQRRAPRTSGKPTSRSQKPRRKKDNPR